MNILKGMTVEIAKPSIKREPAEIVKKLFMMECYGNSKNQSLDGDTIELLMIWLALKYIKKEEVDNANYRTFLC